MSRFKNVIQIRLVDNEIAYFIQNKRVSAETVSRIMNGLVSYQEVVSQLEEIDKENKN